jgi:hypothetical protein
MNLFDQLNAMSGSMSGPKIKAQVTTRICSHCKVEFPLKDFYISKNGKRSSICRPCSCQYQLKKRMDRAAKSGTTYVPRKYARRRIE